MHKLLFSLLWAFCSFFCVNAQTAEPRMTVVADDGTETDETAYDGSAPMKARFTANATEIGNYTPFYEWRFTRQGESQPFLVRYDENTDYVFAQSGVFTVELLISFVNGNDTVAYNMDTPFIVTISESKLEFPNAFTPNGDGYNDVFKAKEGYKSIVDFKATVFNRWGKKLYEWSDLDGGWDGKSGGKDVPDGGYYLVVKARGADGRNYDIKKVINVLRGYTESNSAVTQ